MTNKSKILSNVLRFNIPSGTIVRKNRRRMAWLALISMLLIVIIMMFFTDNKKIEAIAPVIDTLFYCLSAIVLAYNGVALYDDKNLMQSSCGEKKKTEKNDNEEEENSKHINKKTEITPE